MSSPSRALPATLVFLASLAVVFAISFTCHCFTFRVECELSVVSGQDFSKEIFDHPAETEEATATTQGNGGEFHPIARPELHFRLRTVDIRAVEQLAVIGPREGLTAAGT